MNKYKKVWNKYEQVWKVRRAEGPRACQSAFKKEGPRPFLSFGLFFFIVRARPGGHFWHPKTYKKTVVYSYVSAFTGKKRGPKQTAGSPKLFSRVMLYSKSLREGLQTREIRASASPAPTFTDSNGLLASLTLILVDSKRPIQGYKATRILGNY